MQLAYLPRGPRIFHDLDDALVDLVLNYVVIFTENVWRLSEPLDQTKKSCLAQVEVVRQWWMIAFPRKVYSTSQKKVSDRRVLFLR